MLEKSAMAFIIVQKSLSPLRQLSDGLTHQIYRVDFLVSGTFKNGSGNQASEAWLQLTRVPGLVFVVPKVHLRYGLRLQLMVIANDHGGEGGIFM
jgi:hypothetical protein